MIYFQIQISSTAKKQQLKRPISPPNCMKKYLQQLRSTTKANTTACMNCEDEQIDHVTITTGQPRGNGQVEKFYATIILVITKLSLDNPSKWFKHVPTVQPLINSTVSSTTKFTPFELLTGVKMRNKEDLHIKKILEEEHIHILLENQQQMRKEAKSNILEMQEKTKHNYNTKRKTATKYKFHDRVAIKRTQFGTGLKLRPKFFGPYTVTKIRPNNRYDVHKIGIGEEPTVTFTSADLMKLREDP
ncbi:uncharacterized protein [Parasteatoda tepidariorum]|uniref:uncharacterized protein n=1 Tax=Parasteatoda tepidariorum TaxID=114398 RepID=UPI0039BD2A32